MLRSIAYQMKRGFATLHHHQSHHQHVLKSVSKVSPWWWAGATLAITAIVFAPKNTFDNLDIQSFCNRYPEICAENESIESGQEKSDTHVHFDVFSEHEFPYEELYTYRHH